MNRFSEFNNFEVKSSQDEYEAILRCIFTGYFANVAQLQGLSDGSYVNIRSQERIQLHPTSILTAVYPEWIVYHEIVKSSANSYYIHNASKIEADWIVELAGHYYQDTRRQNAESSFQQEKGKDVKDYAPKLVPEEDGQKALVQVGGKK